MRAACNRTKMPNELITVNDDADGIYTAMIMMRFVQTTVEGLSKLRPAFNPKGGTVTVKLFKQSLMVLDFDYVTKKADVLGLKPMAKSFYASAGCQPSLMGQVLFLR